CSLSTLNLMKDAAQKMIDMGASHVLIKGGHLLEEKPSSGSQIYDLFYDGATYTLFEKNYLPQRHLHGVGCTLSAAITAFLAKGSAVLQAVEHAQGFIQDAIQHALSLGQGIGPVNPMMRG
ncbi:MAG: bifunctional hydroxymethylpyrimidine kinase/phosphomethylpyrimidine kinase, partial [bacterium]